MESSWFSGTVRVVYDREAGWARSGTMGLRFLGSSLKILRVFLIRSWCFSFCDLCAARTRGCSGCMFRRVHNLTAALWHMHSKVSSMGRRPACTSRRSVGVDFILPTMARLANLCSFIIRWSTLPNWCSFFDQPALWGVCTRCWGCMSSSVEVLRCKVGARVWRPYLLRFSWAYGIALPI